MNDRNRDTLTGCKTLDAVMLGACCATLATLVPVALKQAGALDHLPDPPVRLFDSDGITQSKTAHPLGVPDSFLGLASFGTTLALMLLAKRNRNARTLLGGKLAADAAFASFNLVRQVVEFRKLCSWCTGTALAALTMSAAGKMVIVDAVSETLAAFDSEN
ncbi:vitamin K epoxide reductase family protein [Terriglobus aquaticus]|uniref:Vitamin K epoxide reductase family protein n=1 Tax=Terriglobus aquaticus TaxID=940139 RepID=A0ABW9KN02_9BACT|nr:vitamin K epoxide reductase family protein [Terriglobus aquaticus]